jgi:hypothetical protein
LGRAPSLICLWSGGDHVVTSMVKRLTKLEDIPYTIETRSPLVAQPGGSWDRKLVLLATVVGSDGFVRDEVHAVEFGDLKVTKRSVTARWAYGALARPDEPDMYDDGKQTPKSYDMREVILPRSGHSQSVGRRVALVRERLAKLLAPQHSWLFRHAEAMEFCVAVHNHVIVHDVMSS